MNLTTQQKQAMAYQAAFLKERIDNQKNRIAIEEAKSPQKRLSQWQKNAGGRGGEDSFHRRLELEGLSREHAIRLAGEGTGLHTGPMPPYMEQIEAMLEYLPFEAKGLCETEENEQNGSMLPFVQYAETLLLAKLGEDIHLFTEDARADLRGILANALVACSNVVWGERFRLFVIRKENMKVFLSMNREQATQYRREFAESLLSGGWLDLFLEFPVLPRIMTVYINNWVRNMAEFAQHFQQDRDALHNTFFQGMPVGLISSIKGNMGDAHNKGRSVLLVKTTEGFSVVYKPRSLEVDRMFLRLMEALKEVGFPYSLRGPMTYSKEDHGWAEFVKHDSVKGHAEASVYYERMGALFALVYILGGNDFHTENLIASGADPVLIDLETIISYQVVPFHEELREMARNNESNNTVANSVLALGILPVWYPYSKDVWLDLGALTGTRNQSVPVIDDEPVSVLGYQKELLEGFQETYRFFAEKKTILTREWLDEIFQPTNAPIRFVMRATRVYAQMLNQVTSSKFLQDGFLYSTEIERFAAPYFLGVNDQKTKELWPIFLSEREAMEQRDIPMFLGRVNALGFWDPNVKLVDHYFEASAIDRVSKRLQGLSEEDLLLQSELIEESLIIRYKATHQETGLPLGKQKNIGGARENKPAFLEEAERIYESLLPRDSEGKILPQNSMAYQHNLRNEVISIGPLNLSFYDGFLGMAFFGAALYRLNKKQEIKDTSMKWISPLRESLRHPEFPLPIERIPFGMGYGIGGMVRAFSLMSEFLQEAELLEDAVYLCEKVKPEHVQKEERVDWYNGLSGLLFATTKLYKMTGKASLKELSDLCGKELLRRQSGRLPHHRYFVRHIVLPEKLADTTGLMDQSGIVDAMYLWKEIGADSDSKIELDRFLSETRQREKERWEKVKKLERQTVSCSLSNGVAGMGIATLQAISVDPEAIDQAKEMLSYLKSQKSLEQDHFSGGNAGLAEWWLSASHTLSDPNLQEEAIAVMEDLLHRRNEKGQYEILGKNRQMLRNPSFFHGLSGIGYMFLRCADPEVIPSFL